MSETEKIKQLNITLSRVRDRYADAVTENVTLIAQVASQKEQIARLREALTDIVSMAGECVPFGDSHCTNSFGTARKPCCVCSARAALAGESK